MASGTKATPVGVEEVQWVLPDGRPRDTIAFEEEMVRFFVDAADLLGVPKSLAAVYAIVFASPQPLSFSEISARLNFSSGSISQALKALREIGAIRPADSSSVRQSAGARACFEPDTEMRRLIQRFLEQRVETQLSLGKTRLANLETVMAAYTETEAKVLALRLNKLRRWHDRTRALMPVIRTFLKLTKI